MSTTSKKQKARTATHRPATRRRRFRHDDLVDPEPADYHSARDLPAGDLLVAGVSCVNHSFANTQRAYAHGLTLFGMNDPDYEDRVTKSERDRATANCVLHYAQTHRPRMILVECTTELQSWGPLLPGSKKIGDGSTYRWWLKQFELLDYNHTVLFLNSQFFGVPQSRNRGYWVFVHKSLPMPDLEHRPVSRCRRCDKDVEAVWTWRTGIPPTGKVAYGEQYEYRCPSCRTAVVPPMTPSIAALDLSDLGTRIGDRPIKTFSDGHRGPFAASTTARIERCRRKFADFPAILMPAKGVHGSERLLLQPLATQTSQQEAAILSTGLAPQGLWDEAAIALAVDNYQGAARGADEPLPTQVGSETLAVVSSGVIAYRKHTVPAVHAEPMSTFTSDQIPGLLTAAGWFKQNGSTGTETAAHPVTDPLGTITARDATALLTADWGPALSELPFEECFYRMMAAHEIGRGCGFDVDFGAYKGSFTVWGTARNQVDGFGNAVSPQVGAWIGARLRAIVHSPQDRGTTTADLEAAA